ncbi:hypothetical protein HDV64DRAFT_7500 [Trichoderma sp. TUCIM 5745]
MLELAQPSPNLGVFPNRTYNLNMYPFRPENKKNRHVITNKVPSLMRKPPSRGIFQPQALPIGSTVSPSRAAAATKTASRALNFRGAPANMNMQYTTAKEHARPHKHDALIFFSLSLLICVSGLAGCKMSIFIPFHLIPFYCFCRRNISGFFFLNSLNNAVGFAYMT